MDTSSSKYAVVPKQHGLTTVTKTSSEPMKTQSKETVEASAFAICWKNRSDQAASSGHIPNPHIRTLFVMIMGVLKTDVRLKDPDVDGAAIWWRTNVTLKNNHKRHCYIHAADSFTSFLTPSTKTQRSFLKTNPSSLDFSYTLAIYLNFIEVPQGQFTDLQAKNVKLHFKLMHISIFPCCNWQISI